METTTITKTIPESSRPPGPAAAFPTSQTPCPAPDVLRMVMPLANDESPKIIPWVTYLLIGVNLGCFILEQFQPMSFTIAYAATPYELTHNVDISRSFAYRTEPEVTGKLASMDPPREFAVHQAPGPTPIWLTTLTSLFLHANLLHLAGNMLFLSIFGQKIEEAFGRSGYLACYLTSGIIGTWMQVWAVPESLTPILGASGSIAGVMGVYLVWFPRDRVRVLVFNMVMLIPAYAVISTWIGIQAMQGAIRPDEMSRAGNVAHLSHISGAVVGIMEGMFGWAASLIVVQRMTTRDIKIEPPQPDG